MKKLPPIYLWLLPIVSGIVFVTIWYGIKQIFEISDWLVPTPAQIANAAWNEKERLLRAAGSTALGAIGGFVLATTVGFGFALLLALSKKLHAGLYPWLLALQMTPVIVLTPLIQLWIGPGNPGIITITWLISFFPIVVNTTHGLLSADMNHVALFRMCNASRWQELFLLRVPAALPSFLAGLRIAAALAPVGAIFGEYMVGNAAGKSGGLGFLVYSYNTQLKIPALFATALTSCLLGFIFVAAISWLNWVMLRKWHDSYERNDH
jgi:NitT/TauT family transport system permease protein